MTTNLYESKETNGLAGILSKVTKELASPFILYSNYRRDLSEGKRNLELSYQKRKGQLEYEMELSKYEQKLERKLQEPEISEKIFGAINNGIQYLKENYDWEKEKKQARAIGSGTLKATKGVAKGTRWAGKGTLEATKYIVKGAGWAGRGVKYVGSKYDWEKEKRQARAIGGGIKSGAEVVGRGTLGATKYIAGGVEWIGRKAWSETPKISEKIFGTINDGIQYLRENYDWEKEKRQAKAIGGGISGATKYIAGGVEWIGRKAWSETLAKDRAMSKRRYLDEAYKEEARRQKTASVLQQKYDSCSNAVKTIVKKVGGNPKIGTPEYNKWEGNIRALNAIEKEAKKQGINLM